MSSLDAAYNAENAPSRNVRYQPRLTRIDDDFEREDVNRLARTSTLCPFDGNMKCDTGCMACDESVRCCSIGDTCQVSIEAQTPCLFASYMSTCMMCDNERGEPTLVSAKPGDTCKATTFCTAFEPIHQEKQSSTFLVGSRGTSLSQYNPALNTAAKKQLSFQQRVQQQLFNAYSS